MRYTTVVNRMYTDLSSFDIITTKSIKEFQELLKIFYESENLTNFHVNIVIDFDHFEKETNDFRAFTDLIIFSFEKYKERNKTKKFKKVVLHPWIQFYKPHQNPFIGFKKIFFDCYDINRNKDVDKCISIQGISKLRRVEMIHTRQTEMKMREGNLYV